MGLPTCWVNYGSNNESSPVLNSQCSSDHPVLDHRKSPVRFSSLISMAFRRIPYAFVVIALIVANFAFAASQDTEVPRSAAPPDDGQWVMPAKNYASTRYSDLNQINGNTVKNLRVDFTFSTGVAKGQEAAPLIVNNTMYVVTAYPNILYALDLTKPGAPLKWEYQPHPEAGSQGEACCDVVNRGAVFWQGKIIYNTLDGNTVAVDANNGQQLWKTKLAHINLGETITMAPLIVKDKVLVGNSGGEFGARGWLTALNANNGKLLWQAYATGPDKDVLIGDDFHPFYAAQRGKDLGVRTWPPGAWKMGGGTVWGWIAYDPDLNLVYYGTANAGPWNSVRRTEDMEEMAYLKD